MVINGDVALLTAEAIKRLVEAHEEAGAAATMATMELDEPGGVRARDPRHRRVGASGRRGQGRRGDATPEELEIREVNTGVYAFDGGALIAALQTLDSDNAQGELYLPDVLPRCARPAARSPRTRSATRTSRTASTTASTSRTPAGSPSAASTRRTCATA